MSKVTPRCFIQEGKGKYKLCIDDGDCVVSPKVNGANCLGEIACEQLLPFEGPPEEEIIIDKTFAVFDGSRAFLIEKGSKITIIRYESHMIASYIVTGDWINKGSVIAGKLSRKGTFRKERASINGTIILVTADPLGKTDRYLVLVDTEGVHKKIDCRLEHR